MSQAAAKLHISRRTAYPPPRPLQGEWFINMPGIRDTAYPQLKASLSVKELDDVTPNFVELVWAEEQTRESAPRVGLLALLKTLFS